MTSGWKASPRAAARTTVAVRAVVHRGGAGEHDVVAVGIPARERRQRVRGFMALQRAQPAAVQAHLPPIGASAEATEPRAVVRRGYGDHVRHVPRLPAGTPPGPEGQAPMLWQATTGGRPVLPGSLNGVGELGA